MICIRYYFVSMSKTTLCAANIQCFSKTTKTFHSFSPPEFMSRNLVGNHFEYRFLVL